MSLYQTFPGSDAEPAEYASANPFTCATCGTACGLDVDDNEDQISTVDGKEYCPACITGARNGAYADALREELPGKLAEVVDFMHDLQKEHEPADDFDPHDAYAMLDDMKARVDRSIRYPGKDTGWRDGIMLANDEGQGIISALEAVRDSVWVDLKSSLDLIGDPRMHGLTLPAHQAARLGRQLATLARQVETLKAAQKRTRYGIGWTI